MSICKRRLFEYDELTFVKLFLSKKENSIKKKQYIQTQLKVTNENCYFALKHVNTIAFDLDTKKNTDVVPARQIKAFEDVFLKNEPPLIVQTPSFGRHYIFKDSENFVKKFFGSGRENGLKSLWFIADGIDLCVDVQKGNDLTFMNLHPSTPYKILHLPEFILPEVTQNFNFEKMKIRIPEFDASEKIISQDGLDIIKFKKDKTLLYKLMESICAKTNKVGKKIPYEMWLKFTYCCIFYTDNSSEGLDCFLALSDFYGDSDREIEYQYSSALKTFDETRYIDLEKVITELEKKLNINLKKEIELSKTFKQIDHQTLEEIAEFSNSFEKEEKEEEVENISQTFNIKVEVSLENIDKVAEKTLNLIKKEFPNSTFLKCFFELMEDSFVLIRRARSRERECFYAENLEKFLFLSIVSCIATGNTYNYNIHDEYKENPATTLYTIFHDISGSGKDAMKSFISKVTKHMCFKYPVVHTETNIASGQYLYSHVQGNLGSRNLFLLIDELKDNTLYTLLNKESLASYEAIYRSQLTIAYKSGVFEPYSSIAQSTNNSSRSKNDCELIAINIVAFTQNKNLVSAKMKGQGLFERFNYLYTVSPRYDDFIEEQESLSSPEEQEVEEFTEGLTAKHIDVENIKIRQTKTNENLQVVCNHLTQVALGTLGNGCYTRIVESEESDETNSWHTRDYFSTYEYKKFKRMLEAQNENTDEKKKTKFDEERCRRLFIENINSIEETHNLKNKYQQQIYVDTIYRPTEMEENFRKKHKKQVQEGRYTRTFFSVNRSLCGIYTVLKKEFEPETKQITFSPELYKTTTQLYKQIEDLSFYIINTVDRSDFEGKTGALLTKSLSEKEVKSCVRFIKQVLDKKLEKPPKQGFFELNLEAISKKADLRGHVNPAKVKEIVEKAFYRLKHISNEYENITSGWHCFFENKHGWNDKIRIYLR